LFAELIHTGRAWSLGDPYLNDALYLIDGGYVTSGGKMTSKAGAASPGPRLMHATPSP
jgi:hypothetical protein